MKLGLSLAIVLLAGSLGAFAGLKMSQPSSASAGLSPGLVQPISATVDDESVSEGWALIESLGAYSWTTLKLSVQQNYTRLMRSLYGSPTSTSTKGV